MNEKFNEKSNNNQTEDGIQNIIIHKDINLKPNDFIHCYSTDNDV